MNDTSGNCPGFTGGCGDRSWASPLTQGSSDQLYFEDNTLTNPASGTWATHDCSGGAREVFRFNRVEDKTWAQHDEARGGRSSRACLNLEAYRNYFLFNRTLISCCSPLGINGGTARIWDNDYERRNDNNMQKPVGWNFFRHTDQYRQHHVFGSAGKFTISQITCTGTTATVTVPSQAKGAGHYMLISNGLAGQSPAQQVAGTFQQIIEGSSVSAYNGQKVVTSVPSNNTWTFTTTCGGTANDVGMTMKSPWDQNSDNEGYRAMSQPGSGPSVYPSVVYRYPNNQTGVVTTSPSATSTLPFAYTGGALMPLYIWNNRRDTDSGAGLSYALAAGSTDNGTINAIIQANRDYYNQDNTNCVAGGACTQGIGSGTTLPTTCTAGTAGTAGEGGVFFWKTNEGDWNNETQADHDLHGQGHTLGEDGQGYRCTATNTWTLDYVPADYPHFLITREEGQRRHASSSGSSRLMRLMFGATASLLAQVSPLDRWVGVWIEDESKSTKTGPASWPSP